MLYTLSAVEVRSVVWMASTWPWLLEIAVAPQAAPVCIVAS
jgi:hypothetical protein